MVGTCPPFSLTASRYDQTKFTERAKLFYELTDPRTLLTTDAELKAAMLLLDQFKSGTTPPTTTDADLWNARRIKESMVHPDTGEVVFPLFRFSAFGPVNLAIVPLCL